MAVLEIAKSIGFAALRAGWRLPRPAAAAALANQGTLLSLLTRLRINCVLDVGAHQGWFAQHLRRGGYTGRIVTFEPNPDNHVHIAAKAEGDWLQEDCALGEVEERRTFNVLNDEGGSNTMSSFLSTKLDVPSRSIDVQVRRLDSLMTKLLVGIDSPRVFLKVDTQGFDLPVVRGAAASLDLIKGLQSEISVQPIYHGMTPYTDSLAAYHELGFALVDLQVVRRNMDGTVVEYDCLMAKS